MPVHVTHLSPHILSPHHHIGHKLDNIMAQKCSNFITASISTVLRLEGSSGLSR
jgi:hypothetical protein